MPHNWKKYKIIDIATKTSIGPFGSRMKSDCYVKEGVPVIRGKNIGVGFEFISDFVYITSEKADELLSSNVYKNDLVFPHRGSIGEVGILTKDERFVLSSSLMKLTCDSTKAHPQFIYYFFKSPVGRRRLLQNESQVGTPGIAQPISSLRNIDIELPPIKEQRSITSILSALDDKIALNLEMNKTLEEMAMALYKEWFVDFGPFQEGEFVASELGLIPKGWEIKPMKELCEIKNGHAFKSKDYRDSGTTIVRTKDFNNTGYISIDNAIFLNEELVNSFTKFQLENLDFLMVMVGASIGKTVVVYENILPALQNQNMWNFKSNIKSHQPFYISHLKGLIKNLRESASGSAREFFRKEYFYNTNILVPSTDIIEAYSKEYYDSLQMISNNISESQSLTRLRDTLLPKLISGEVRIKEALKQVNQVL